MSDLPRSAIRVQDAATTLGLKITVVEMPESTRTAEEAAAACGCELGQIVKSLIFRGAESQKPYLLLVSGTNRVTEKKVAEELGERLERPDAAFVRDTTGFAIGGVPPFGHAHPLDCYMDRDLVAHEVVWAAAGTPKCLFSVDPGALSQAAGAHVITVT